MNLAVYCGANQGRENKYVSSAEKVGTWIGKNNHTLVYGGGKAGLMGILADSVLANGGKVIGVIPSFLKNRELAHDGLTKLYTVKNMHERKKMMIDQAEAYLALPGGAGTLEEITEVVSWGRIGEHQNPCIFYNEDGYYDLIRSFYSKMVLEGFLTQQDYEKILFSSSLNTIEQFIQNYIPPQIRSYIK